MIIQDNSSQAPNNLEPDVVSSYNHGINSIGKYLGPLLIILIVVLLFGIPPITSSFLPYTTVASLTAVIVVLYFYSFFVTTPLEYGVSYTFLKAVRDETPAVKNLGVVLVNYWNIILAILLVGIIVSMTWIESAFAALYHDVAMEKNTTVSDPEHPLFNPA